VPNQEPVVEISGKIPPKSLGEDDLVHACAERGTIHVKRGQARPGDMRGKLDGAVAWAGQVVQGLGQPAAVPLLKDRGTRDWRCIQQAVHATNYALPRAGGEANPPLTRQASGPVPLCTPGRSGGSLREIIETDT
jgi:hypothetical protein